ncbi:MAG: AMIN domain-containing protein [Nitrospirales bacterium]|nr:AMIN domain-containing protein [Nitrospira sp.]MDR4500352.1 AMIN domain-containing protein [Nitrospirales bacterium]
MNTRASGLILTAVTVQRRTNHITVFIRGRGNIRFHPHVVSPQLLAVDFPNGSSSLSFQTLQVGHRLLEEVRIEQYPQKLRLAFSLTARVRYAIKTTETFLAVRFAA